MHGLAAPRLRRPSSLPGTWVAATTERRKRIEGFRMASNPSGKELRGQLYEPFTELEQDQLDWLSRFADRLRLLEPRLAAEDHGTDLNDLARQAWDRLEWRRLGPEASAARWLERRSLD